MSHPNSSTACCSVYLNFNGNKVTELLRANTMWSIGIFGIYDLPKTCLSPKQLQEASIGC